MANIKNVFSRRADNGILWENLSKTFVVLGLLLTPILVLPWTSDPWELNKAMALMLMVSLAWICYFLATLRRRTSVWKWQMSDWAPIGLAGSTLVSTIFSLHPWQSLTGLSGWYSETLPMTLAFVSLYFLIGQLFRSRHDQMFAWASLGVGVGLGLLLQMFQFSGVALLPSVIGTHQLNSVMSNSYGQIGVLGAIFASAMIMLWRRTHERWMQWMVGAGALLGWLTVFFIGQPIGWAVFAVGMIVVVFGQAQQPKTMDMRVVGLAVGLAALGLLIQFTNLRSHTSLPSSQEIIMPAAATTQVAVTTLQHRPVFGSGPETWYEDFVRFRSTAFNQQPYWNIRFIKGGNQWWQTVATLGLAGTLAWLAILFFGFRQWVLAAKDKGNDWPMVGLLVLLGAIVSGLFGVWSLTLQLALWATLGLGRAAAAGKGSTRPIGLWTPVGFAVAGIIFVFLWFPAVKIYASDVVTKRGESQIAKTAPLEQVKKTLQDALQLNLRNERAAILLANADTTDALLKSQDQKTDIAPMIRQAVQGMKQTIALDPNNPALYEEMNNILNRLSAAVADVDQQAMKNFQTLEKIEPASPIHDVGYGQTLMLARAKLLNPSSSTSGGSDTTQVGHQAEQLLNQALQAYDRALSKKPDYAQAHFAKAQAFRLSGKYSDGLAELDTLTASLSNVPELWIERGTILSKMDENDKAVAAFQQARQLEPNSADPYLALAQHYFEHNKKDLALAAITDGLKVLPTDQALLAKQVEIQSSLSNKK